MGLSLSLWFMFIGAMLCTLLFVVSFVCLYIIQCDLPDWLLITVGILEVIGVLCMVTSLILIIFQI